MKVQRQPQPLKAQTKIADRASMGLPAIKMTAQQDMGADDSLRYNISNLVVQENYDQAIAALKDVLTEESEFPMFKDRVERYVRHSVDLVNAIRAKRNFPGFNMLTQAKQRDINENYRQHFDELQAVLIKIEKIKKEMVVQDLRSTIIIVKAFVNAALAVAVLAFVLETTRGFGQTVWTNLDDGMLRLTDAIFGYLGW